MKRNLVFGLILVLALGCLPAGGAELQGRKPARTSGAAEPAPTVVDRLVGTIRTISRLGKLVVPDGPVTLKAPPFCLPNEDLTLPECDPSLDPQVACRVRQPIG